MPLNETRRKPRRERWPLAFDLEGVPRDAATRTALLNQIKLEELTLPEENFPMSMMHGTHPVQNTFTVDQVPKSAIVDINNPPQARYVPQSYPRMLYKAEGQTCVVEDEKQEAEKTKKGWMNAAAYRQLLLKKNADAKIED